MVGFIRAYRAATDWLYDRANREIVEALLVANIRDMSPALAKQSYDLLLADKGGLARDLAPDPAGMRTVLRLRSKFGLPQKTLSDPMKYVDLSYYEKALGLNAERRIRKPMARKAKEPTIVRPDDIDPHTAGTGRCSRPATRRSTSRSASISGGCTTTGSRARAPRSRIPDSARCCASTSTTSATPPAPSSASGRATS